MGLNRVENVTTSQIIKEARKREGITQKQLCELADIPISTYQRFESGDTDIGINRFIDMVDVLGYEIFISVHKKGVIA